MSRSYAPSDDGYSRYSASSPMTYVDDDPPQDPSLRPMRLKVLYTCDDKANCMAKWYQIVHVRTAFLDEKTEVGVVELKTCIKAIVTCSPELVAKLGQDYTVYAYDYSEYETPLVGQGMLSWVLASASPTPSAPAEQSSTMVTGRVTKNAKGLFARDSIAQTLEVKLRLVPVPTILQSEYIESMKSYRDISQVMPTDFDSQGWSEFISANPQILSMINSGRNDSSQQSQNHSNNIGIEQVQRLMQRTQSFNQRMESSLGRRDSFAGSVVSYGTSRGGSPTPSAQTHLQDSYIDHNSRPGSRGSNKDLRRSASNDGFDDSGFASNDERQDDGPARKRARTTQAKRPRKAEVFGNKVESLRVVASTAASVRVHQPTAIRPGAVTSNSLEEPPRVPTPTPHNVNLGLRRPNPQPRRSGLGQVMSSLSSSDQGPAFQGTGRSSGSAILSPEALSTAMSSPGEDPGSSPPVPVTRGATVQPSSPELPRMPPPHEDSGFMSGNMEEEQAENSQPKPSVEIDPTLQANVANAGPAKPQPKGRSRAKRPRASSTASQMTAEEAAEKAAEVSRKNARRAIGWRRIQSWTEGQSSDAIAPASEMPPPEPKTKQIYDRDHQKHLIQGRLATAVENGELPPYCENCGEINTPTWRKAYSCEWSGAPGSIPLTKAPGGVVAVQIIGADENGQVTRFRTIKKTVTETDEGEGYEAMLLCNPCGLWLVNRKQMRPQDKWNTTKKKEPRSGTGRSRQSASRGRSATAAPSDMTEPLSEFDVPPYEPRNVQRALASVRDLPQSEAPEQDDEPELPTLPEEKSRPESRSNVKARSDGTAGPTAMAALQRAIQSSPGLTRGSKHSPINVDQVTPDPTRRMLFPSPKTKGPLGVTSGNGQRHSLSNSPDAPKQYMAPKAPISSLNMNGQENTNPVLNLESAARPTTPTHDDQDDADYFHDLFHESKMPATPSRNNINLPAPKSPSDFFKTPTKYTPQKNAIGTGDFFSSAAKAFLHPPRTPSRTPSKKSHDTPTAETPFTRHINQLLSEPVGTFDLNTSPSALFADFGANFNDFAMSTDMPMPSSPPVGASMPKAYQNEDWSELGLNSSPFKSVNVKNVQQENENANVDKEQEAAAS